jgi:hypothetical protein
MENDTKQSSCSPLPFGFYNMDCMTGMKCFPDKYFDLAIVDPVYGDVTNGGYMKNQIRGGVGPYKDYDLSIWQQQKTGQEYFDELFKVGDIALQALDDFAPGVVFHVFNNGDAAMLLPDGMSLGTPPQYLRATGETFDLSPMFNKIRG